MAQKKAKSKKGENKTKPTKVSVAAFLKQKATGQQLADSQELVKLFSAVTGEKPTMWGPSIVGFGSVHYVYESGREGDMPVLGFSPRKPETVIYLEMSLFGSDLMKKLGPHKEAKCCLYIKRLADVDFSVLSELARQSAAETWRRYPVK
jgi:hypothetical protein